MENKKMNRSYNGSSNAHIMGSNKEPERGVKCRCGRPVASPYSEIVCSNFPHCEAPPQEKVEEGKYIGEYPVPVRLVVDRMAARGARIENQDPAFIEEQMREHARENFIPKSELKKVVEKYSIDTSELGEQPARDVILAELELLILHLP